MLKYPKSFLDINEDCLSNIFEKYNYSNEINGVYAVSEDGYIASFCPLLAKRVHELDLSAKVVYVDSFLSSENSDIRIFLLLTTSEVGCLPLGVIVISSDNLTMTSIGFSLLQNILDDLEFNENKNGPNIFITDEYFEDNDILTSIWPKSKSYLSISHVLQNIWQWLSNNNNNISSDDKALLFKDFYNALYAKTEADFICSFDIAKQNGEKYENYLHLLDHYFNKKKLWAMYSYPEILTNDDVTIKFSESTMRFLREKLSKDLINLDFMETINYIINDYFTMFEKRLIEIVSGNVPDIFFKNMINSEELMRKVKILGQNMRLVPSQSSPGVYYIINIDLLTCTCSRANSSSICKHVQCVCMILYEEMFKKNCQNIDIQKKCRFIATGKDQNPTNPPKVDDLSKTTVKDEYVKEGKEILQKMFNIFDSLIDNSACELSPVIKNIANKLEIVQNVSDLKSSFSIFDSAKSKTDHDKNPGFKKLKISNKIAENSS